jgi:hypothetical protein
VITTLDDLRMLANSAAEPMLTVEGILDFRLFNGYRCRGRLLLISKLRATGKVVRCGGCRKAGIIGAKLLIAELDYFCPSLVSPPRNISVKPNPQSSFITQIKQHGARGSK